MATSAERQKAYRKRLKESGLVAVTGFVPAAQAGEIMQLMKQLCEDRNLEVGPARNAATGRLVARARL